MFVLKGGTTLRGEVVVTELTCAVDVDLLPEVIESSLLYQNWIARFDDQWRIEKVHFTSALAWKGDVRMAFAHVTAITPDGRRKKSAVFLRGSTVDILPVIIAPDSVEYVVFVEQSRIPAAQVCISTPAGMVDYGNVESTALQEMAEEVGGDITWSTPQWLNQYATGSNEAMLVSPGGTDEDVQFCVVRAYLDETQMQSLHGSKAGAAEEDEHTSVHVVVLLTEALPYLARYGRPSLKTVTSLLLYQLSRQFRLS